MKKRISIFLALVFVFTMVLPIQSFAAGLDQSLESAIRTAKTKFDIPEDYKFESSIGNEGDKKVFFLSWTSKDTTYQSSINVTVNEDGIIQSYYSYSPDDYADSKKIPAISKKDAQAKAEEYLKEIDSSLPSKIKLQPELYDQGLDGYFYFNYYRVENGIPFYSNNVNVSINKQTGKLQNFYRNWNADLKFPTPATMTLDEAQKAYKENMGLKLVYKYNYDYNNNQAKPFPAYVPIYNNQTYVMDATTGEKVQLQGYYGVFEGGSSDMAAGAKEAENGEVVLTPDEIKAIEDAGKLITQEEAEKIAQEAEFLGLTSEYKLTSYNLYPNWPIRSEYTWNLSYTKEGNNPQSYDYKSISVHANTGLVTSFYSNTNYQADAKAVYDKADAKVAADNFLKKYYPEYFKQVKYDDIYLDMAYPLGDKGEAPLYLGLKYNRVVNGVEFPENGVNIEYNAVDGSISSFNISWFDMEFPSVTKVISAEAAYDKFFDDLGLMLEYRLQYQDYYAFRSADNQPNEAILVYSVNTNKPHIIDAFTGEILNYDGSPFKEYKEVKYSDIDGSYAKENIKALAENGIYLHGTEFRPNEVIKQRDFLWLLGKTLNYYGTLITENSSQTDIDNFYNYLIREGVILPEEKAPESAVKREDGVKFVIRALKYDKVAQIENIFKDSPFTDADKISEGLKGHVAIGTGLKIVNGYNGAFYPQDEMTRAAATVMIYNYLQK